MVLRKEGRREMTGGWTWRTNVSKKGKLLTLVEY